MKTSRAAWEYCEERIKADWAWFVDHSKLISFACFAFYCWDEKPYGAAFFALCILLDELRDIRTKVIINLPATDKEA